MNILIKAVVWILFFFTIVPVSYGIMDFNLPEGTKFLLYIKDVRNLEDNLRKAGILDMPSEYFDFFVEYVKQDQPALQFYKDLKNMEDGNFIKSVIGEMAILNLMNDNLVAIRLQKGSAYFSRLMDVFNVKGSFNGYYVDFSGDKVILCRNKAAISFYKGAAGKKSDDPVLNLQTAKDKDPDILYYKSGDVLVHPWLDSLIASEGGKKSISIALNFSKKSFSVYTSPALPATAGHRVKFPGQTIQSTALAFFDMARNPSEAFRKVFGTDAVAPYEKIFKDNFEEQTSIALTSLSPDITPSFVIAARPKGGKSQEAENAFRKFLTEALGESKWSKQNINGLSVNFGGNTGIYMYSIAGLFVVSDSREAVSASSDVFAGKVPSVWENKENAKLKDMMEKPSAFYVDVADLADSIYKSMLNKMTLNSSQKEDLKTYINSIRGMGSLVGYSEDKKDFNYYYFVLKGK